MPCRPREIGPLEHLRQPIRVGVVVVGAGLLIASLWLSGAQHGVEVAVAGAALLFFSLLLPVLTEFEIDVFGVHARANLSSRAESLKTACEQETHTVASLASLIGVDPVQAAPLAQEAVEDACRLWRGKVVPDLVRAFVVCRAVHLVQVSIRLGGPYRVTTPPAADGGAAWNAFAGLPPQQRMIVALAEYAELDAAQIAGMLDLDRPAVDTALAQVAPGRSDGGAPA